MKLPPHIQAHLQALPAKADASACKRAFIFPARSLIVDKFLIDFYLEK